MVTTGADMQLTDIVVKKLSKAGRHTDDQTKGLHLWVKATGQKYWIFRYTNQDKRPSLSFGSYPEVGLRQARDKAIEARNQINKGIDPLQEKKAAKSVPKPSEAPRFKEFALAYIETMRPKWRNQKHGDQWVATVASYAFPVIGGMPLDEIETQHMLEILTPIWHANASAKEQMMPSDGLATARSIWLAYVLSIPARKANSS